LYKVRNKRIALIIAVVFALSIMLPMAAFAADSITVTSAAKQNVPEDQDTDLGWIRVSVDDEVYSGGSLYVDVDLPTDVKFTKDEESSRSFGPVDASTAYTINFSGDNSVTVGSGADDDIYVDVTVRWLDGANNLIDKWEGSVLVATKGDGSLTVSTDNIPTLSAGEGKEIADITFEENIAGAAVGAYVYLELPGSYAKWENPSGITPSGKYGLDDTVTLTRIDDNETLVVGPFDESSPFAGEVTIENLPITLFPNAPEGALEVNAWCTDGDLMGDTTITVAYVGEADIAVSVEENSEADDAYVGATNVELNTIKFESDSEFSGNDVIVYLPDGVEFDNVVGGRSDAVRVIDTFNDGQSVWVALDDGVEEAELTLAVNITADAVAGDLEVTVGGDADATAVLAEIKDRVSVTADKPEITVGLARAAGDITIVETAKNAFATNNGTLSLELSNGAVWASEPTVEVNGTEIDDVTINTDDDSVLDITLSNCRTTRIDTVVITDVEIDLDARVNLGDLEIGLLGDAVNVENAEEAVANVAIATVVDEAVVTTSFTLGDEGVTVVNGRTLVQVNLLVDVLGLAKSWDSATKTAYFVKDGKVVAFPMGENAIYINGVKVPVDQGGMIINDYTYATLRGLQMAFGGELEWDGATKTATFNFTK
jgi:hypothetical protein